ncbi:MAG: HAD-IA family hydrolase, partial [Clostridium sp.]|nr:HAD-IA family hydrolase [Clostridium sp.]
LRSRYDLYIITNGISETQYRRLRDSGLDEYFTDIFVSEDAGSQKPQKEFFDYCFLRIREKDPSQMLIIGDSLSSDIRGGKNAGIATCWLDDGSQQMATDLKPDYVIHALEELKTFL